MKVGKMKKTLALLTVLTLGGCVSAPSGYRPEPLHMIQLPPQRYQQCEVHQQWNRYYHRWENVRRCREVYR
jgi:hypothetical protein